MNFQMRFLTTLAAMLLIAIGTTLGEDVQKSSPAPAKVYGTPSATAIAITVSSEYKEDGVHYVPTGTTFREFLKLVPLHLKGDIDPWSGVKLMRNGKRVKNLTDGTTLVEGDVIRRLPLNW